jgi:GNAT superfamily N-acetyltransferase
MLIRQLKEQEIRKAAELKQKCWNEDFKGIIPPDAMDLEEEVIRLTNWLKEDTGNGKRVLYGAFLENEFMGYAGACLAEKKDAENGVELKDLFLKKDFRGRNISLKLIKTIIDEFLEKQPTDLIIYNWHGSDSNNLYNYLGGTIFKQITRKVKEKEIPVDVFKLNLKILSSVINEKLRTSR